ncbi:MAG: outer membrane beta-barrel protein [Sulfuricaulis sp.]
MKKLLIFITIGLGTTSIGVARAAPVTFYAEADVVSLSQKNTDDSGVTPSISGTAKTTNLRLRGGLHVLSWLDTEFHIILSKTGDYNDSAGGNVSLKTSVVGIFAKPNIDLGPINLYGLIGVANVSSDISSATTGGTARHSGFSAGAGVLIPVTKKLSVTADYVQYNKSIDYGNSQKDTVSAVGVGANYTF